MASAELKTLGRYNLDRILGKGAMGVVYEGVDPRLNRRVAIKTILKSNLDEDTAKDFAMRFVREAQAVARLNHPNIVQVYDFGEEGEIAYLVMEFIKGKELKNFFDANERFDLKEAVRIMCELCDALEFAHQAGIVHRDIKPANVMLDAQARTKLTDFGVARVQDNDKTSVEKTQAGTMVGTPAYMSPEQITGGTVDKRSDVFSAGIILYQFLTGEKPFTGGGAWTIAKKIIQEDPPLPSTINNAVTPLFDSVVNKALAKNPAERYQSARDLSLGLKRALEGKPAEDDSDKTIVGGAMPDMPKAQPRPAAAAAAPGQTAGTMGGSQAGSQEVELEFWRAIKDGNDPDDFELYVQQFPTGIYAALAKRKIAKLRGEPLDDSSVKAREAEKKEAEDAARKEAEAKTKLAEEKTKLEAELKRREEEFQKREAEAELKRQEAEKSRLEAIEKAKQEAAAERERAKQEAAAAAEKARQEAAAERERTKAEAEKAKAEAAAERDRARKEAAAEAEKAKAEAAAALAKREAEYKKQEAEAKAKRDAEEKARQEAEAKSRKESEARLKKEAEDRARREAEFKKREAELKAQAEEATLLATGKKKPSVVIPVIIAIVVAGIGIGIYSYISPSDEQAKAQIAAMQKQLAEAQQKAAAEAEAAKKNEAEAKQALAKAQAAEEAAKKSGDLAQQKALAEARAKAEADMKQRTEAASAANRAQQDAAKKEAEVKSQQDRLARAEAEKKGKAEAARVAAEQKAAQDRAAAEAKAASDRAVAEAKAAADRAIADARAATEKAQAEARAAQEKAAAERAKIASAPPASGAAATGEQLFEQASSLERDGKGAEAVRTYTRAARSGSGKAAKRLGEIYDKGVPGVPRDYAESLKWYNTARALGEDIKDNRRQ
jgi:serine/threonine-protein kinase